MKGGATIRRVLRRDSGSGMIEYALSVLLFLTMVFSAIDFSFLLFTKLTLQNAARQAGRYAITGQSMTGLSRYASILSTVQTYSLGRATSNNTTVCSASLGCGSGGGPQDTVTITITYPYKFITPFVAPFFKNGSYTIVVSTTFKNEPFPPSET